MKSLKTTLTILGAMMLSNASFALESSHLLKVTGKNIFEDHAINQYDDVEDPPQGYEIVLPAGIYLAYTATPDDGNGQCVARYEKQKRTVFVEAHDLETDAGGCYAFLIFQDVKTGKQETVSYYIEQTGT